MRTILIDHFASEGMTSERLDQIVGTGSMLSMIIAPIRYNILNDPAFGWCNTDDITGVITCDFRTTELRRKHLEDVTTYQWGSGSFISNTALYVPGVTPVYDGIASLQFSNYTFQSAPEYGIYL